MGLSMAFCRLARTLGLPVGSLDQLPLRELVRRYAERARR